MNPASIPPSVASAKDASDLAVVAVLHFVNAALSFFCAFFTIVPISLLIELVLYPINALWPELAASLPEMMRETFRSMVVLSLIALTFAIPVLNLLSGIFMISYRQWKLSMITAWLTCLNIPLGTILGIFTIRILRRPGVRAKYARSIAATRQTI